MKTNLKDMTLSTTCPICKTETEIAVSASDYLEWVEGKSAQDAFPYLSANEREAIISGICSKCWDNMFSTDDANEEDEEEEEDFEYDDCDFEIGFDPYMGCFTDDC